MRDFFRETNAFLSRFLTPTVRIILVANVAIFILTTILAPLSKTAAVAFALLMQNPVAVVRHLFLWQLVTYMFLHASFTHLLFNMLLLWFFGPRLEYRWGSARFLRFYLIVGVGSGLFHLVLALVTGKTGSLLLGASGALYGILMAWALYWPNDDVYLYGIFRMKIKHLVILATVLAFLGSTGGAGGGISHITHLGGLVVALIYIKGPDWFRRVGAGAGGGGGRKRERVIQVDPRRHPDFR